MAEGVISALFNTINNYLIDLGLVSKTVGEKALDKINSSTRQSIFSSSFNLLILASNSGTDTASVNRNSPIRVLHKDDK